ncbi:Heat shock 70 kDa protein [Senna tora]|uniref:Heat shock 70 kDa protein n=1 Tax=Senna tora TaxID=362788 RepID=A0A834SPF4_9FABA|nr:Heat shock 70 kDa protein [Senna tora]
MDRALTIKSKEALELIKNGTADNHPCSRLVHCIRECINRCWNVDLQHVYREANRAADLMAKLSHSIPEGLQSFDAPHAELGSILSSDLSGLLLPRLKLHIIFI